MITPTLEVKLAAVMKYLMDVRAQRRSPDSMGLHSYLDDPQICEWIDKLDKDGRINNVRFLRKDLR